MHSISALISPFRAATEIFIMVMNSSRHCNYPPCGSIHSSCHQAIDDDDVVASPCMDGFICGCMYGCMDVWMDACIDGCMDGRMDGWMDGWIAGCIDR